jgi:peroxiredoxin
VAELGAFKLHPGDPAPTFSLPGVDGKVWGLDDFASDPFLVVVFWCNHCPYVQAWEGRTIALANKYGPQGVRFVLINSNDARSYPDDGFDRMVDRAREHGYPFPYLHDASQSVARSYGGLVTPHPMLFDRQRRLLYQGRIDDNHERPDRVRARYLEAALEAALAEAPIQPAERPVLGCSIKWKA